MSEEMRWLGGITDYDGHESERAQEDGGGQRALESCSLWGCGVTERQARGREPLEPEGGAAPDVASRLASRDAHALCLRAPCPGSRTPPGLLSCHHLGVASLPAPPPTPADFLSPPSYTLTSHSFPCRV